MQPGNSGGPVFDNNGYLIGNVSTVLTETQNVGYAIKISYLQKLIESSDENITLPTINSISAFNIANQVKSISPCVPRIVAVEDTMAKQHAESLLAEAELWHSAGFNQKAHEALIESIKKYPTNEAFYLSVMVALDLYRETEDIDYVAEIVYSCNYCIEEDYNSSVCYLILGIVSEYSELFDTAIECYDKALMVDSSNYIALMDRGALYCKLKKYDKAIDDLLTAKLMRNKNNEEYFSHVSFYLALAYLHTANYPKSDYYASEYLQLYPRSTEANYLCAQIKFKMHEYRDCLKFLNNTAVIDVTATSKDEFHVLKGIAYDKLGFTADAYQEFCNSHTLDIARLYYIREFDAVREFDAERIDFDYTSHYNKVYNSPKIDKNKTDIKILAIEATDEKTVVTVEYTNLKYPVYGWYDILPTACIVDTSGEKFRLLTTENCSIDPEKTYIDYRETAKFQLIFEAIPKECHQIDFIESSEESSWNIYGIQLID